MNTGLLVLLNAQLAGVLVYAANEWRSAKHYRTEHLQVREDDLVYQDLIARLHMRRGGGAIIASAGREHESRSEQRGEQVTDSHNSSFQKVGT